MSDPIRTCILSRDEAPRDGLIRLALSPDGRVLPDIRAKAPGRGQAGRDGGSGVRPPF